LKNVASNFSNCRRHRQDVVSQAGVSVSATSITTSRSSDDNASRIRWLSASEWAGLPLSTSIAR